MRPDQAVSRILYPGPVTWIRGDGHSSRIPVARYLQRPTRELGRAALKHSSIWSCTEWGLPSFSDRPENWCALTAPFHPYPASRYGTRFTGRFAFCCTCLRVATTPCYGALCPAVFGLSSSRYNWRPPVLLRPLSPMICGVNIG